MDNAKDPIDLIILGNPGLSYAELETLTGIKERTIRIRKRRLGIAPTVPQKATVPELSPQESIETEIQESKWKRQSRVGDAKLKAAYNRIEELEEDLENAMGMKGTVQTFEIKPSAKKGKTQSTAFLICSDWHCEQRVDGGTVSGLNEFNPTICEARVNTLFQKTVEFIRIYQQDADIDTLVLALLGDFINGNIHDELKESNYMLPVDAAIFAQNLIASGIEYILAHSNVKLVVPCHSGNHPRITKKVHHGTEKGNSLESFIYFNLAQYFRHEPRVTFLIAEGYHSYLNVYGRTIRFHHGHNVKFGGGIGGLFIPAFKAISQWDKARPAELDVFGHFHQTKDGGKFLCNGSLVGYDTFALSIKADYEPPKQYFFLYHEELGRTTMSPIYL
jgi:hypothetical protein